MHDQVVCARAVATQGGYTDGVDNVTVTVVPTAYGDLGETVQVELHGLERRRHLASAAITACTFSALLVCTVIAALFLEVLLQVELKWLLGLLFTASTLALVVGLAYFLREVHLATRTVRFPAFGAPERADGGTRSARPPGDA